ncbi:MAG TPA: RNA polymerase sigma factor, partial [Solirubrobacteraceae bacterium]|nr:RNA polymerase sigma factor [Solirubrobacteraceae bacterium]
MPPSRRRDPSPLPANGRAGRSDLLYLASTRVLRRQSDERLVALARAGHARAVEVIFARYHAPLLRHCRRLLGPSRAEDAVQQTFLKAYRGICEGDSELELRAWLYRIAQNVSHDLLRQRVVLAEPSEEARDAGASAADAHDQRERFGALVAAMKRLPWRQRRAIVGRELEGRSHADLASELGVTDGAVRQLIHRARSTLRGAASAVIPGAIGRWWPLPAPTPSTASSMRASEAIAGAGGTVGAVKIGATLAATGAIVAGGIAPPLAPDAPARRHGSSRPPVTRSLSRPARAQTASASVSRVAAVPAPAAAPGVERGDGAVRADNGARADRAAVARSGADVAQTGQHQGENTDVAGPPPPSPAAAAASTHGGQQQGHA